MLSMPVTHYAFARMQQRAVRPETFTTSSILGAANTTSSGRFSTISTGAPGN